VFYWPGYPPHGYRVIVLTEMRNSCSTEQTVGSITGNCQHLQLSL